MKILAFDTSTKYLSIACLEDTEVMSSYHEDIGIKHSEVLVSTIGSVLDTISWALKDIDLVSVGLGPGSFTGLRIGAAACKGFAAVLGTKVVGVPTMDAIVLNIEAADKTIAPFLDARKQKIYTCLYKKSKNDIIKTTEYLLTDAGKFLDSLEEEVLFFGDAVEKYKDLLDKCSLAKYDLEFDWYPRAVNVALLGYRKSKQSFDDPDTIDPLYLHSKECNVTKKKK